jgi:DNA integrity scanning protein DisA with diadenylate cyclase activity
VTRDTGTYRLLPLLAQRKVRADWIFEGILCHATVYDADVVESLLELAIEIAREGREGRRVGTVFTLGDEEAVLARSRPLILDPMFGTSRISAPT